jgi:hypothetical protein
LSAFADLWRKEDLMKVGFLKACSAITVFLLLILSVFFTTCTHPNAPNKPEKNNTGNLEDTPDGDTRLVVAIHDTPFKKDNKTVEKLNITVKKMVIIDDSGTHTTILDEERSMDILAISKNNPVVLSDVSVEPGVYQELRLVLTDNSTIQVDGEVFSIKTPSGEQSGLKLKGPFEIPAGKLFRLTIDFVAAESVIYNKGQGYILKPVLRISSAAEIIGVFRGNLTVANSLGACETLLQLYSDNTARLRVADFPKYTVWADYNYNSSKKELHITDINLDAPGLGRRKLRRVMKKLPDEITLPVKQWSIDSIIAVDINGLVCNLYRVDDFDFSDGVTFTEFTLNIDYPDASKIGKKVITEVRFIDTGMPPATFDSTFEGSRITETVPVLNSFIQGSSTRIQVTSYLFDSEDDMNIEMGVYASRPAVFMTGSYASETTDNPWQSGKHIFTLQRDGNQEFTVTFSQHLNIRMDHGNFTNNNPIISWNPYPGANNGYFVLVFVRDKDGTSIDDGSDIFAIAYHTYTQETQVTVYSSRIKFTPTYTTIHEIPPSIVTGDIIRIEIFVLDGSGTLNTRTKQGAFLMDAITIQR